jgi:phosphate transport system substrate-binding protein
VRKLILLTAIVTAVLVPAAVAAATITMSGSTSVAPLAILLAKTYKAKVNHSAKFIISQGGSDIGIADAAHGRVTIGNSSRDPIASSDPKGLVFNKIARDGVCIVTNTKNPLASVSQATVQQIFSGRVRNWNKVSGAKISGPIDLISRTASSGTRDAFQNIFMGQRLAISGAASQKSTNGLVQQSVKSDRAAIAYVDFKFTGGTHVASYKGVACNLRNAKSGTYGGVRNFWMVTRGRPSGAAKSFITWVQKSGAARKIVASGWVPLH